MIDLKGFLNIRVFKEQLDEKEVILEIGKSYVISLFHTLGKDGRMRLRFKSIISLEILKNSYFRYFNIYIENTECISDLKDKLYMLEQGNKKVNLIYKNIEISSGLSIDSTINLENIIGNIRGIKNIEKII